jgi:hypothetical protein
MPYQDACYTGLFLWSVYSVIASPVTPVTQNMPHHVVTPYVWVGVIAPLVAIAGQVVTRMRRRDCLMYTVGWGLQWGGDAAVTCTLVVALVAFMRATGEPSAILAIAITATLLAPAALLVADDILEMVVSVCRRRRNLQRAVADEL